MHLVEQLLENFNAELHSEINPYPSDIDICIDENEVEIVKSFLKVNDAVLVESRDGVIKHAVYINTRLYILDIKYSFSAYYKHLSAVSLSNKGASELHKCQVLHKIFKYLCQNRKCKKEYIKNNSELFANFIRDRNNFTYISPVIQNYCFSFDSDLDVIFSAFQIRSTAHGIQRVLSSYAELIKEYFRCRYSLGMGKSIAFVGPDGSGKSFYIENLIYPHRQKNVYMGDWFFKLQSFYNDLMKVRSPFNRFIYFFYFIENTYRSFKVFLYKIFGYVVLIDRFPGTNRNVSKTGVLGILNTVSYVFTKKPNEIILLYASPNEVFSRKQELTVDQILDIQNSIVKLVGKRLVILDTANKDKALNSILKLIYKEIK